MVSTPPVVLGTFVASNSVYHASVSHSALVCTASEEMFPKRHDSRGSKLGPVGQQEQCWFIGARDQ